MRTLFILLVMSLWLSETSLAQQVASNEFSKLNWLEGKWERQDTKPGQTAFETWTKTPDSFKGEGISMRGRDTVFVEKLSIKLKEGVLYYVAEPSGNDAPTDFKITRISDTGFISENPDHDFPKKIAYELVEDGTMKATISGNGQAIPFIFRKVNE